MCHCVCVHVFTRVLMRKTIYKAADLFNPELQYYFQDMATRSSYKKKTSPWLGFIICQNKNATQFVIFEALMKP